MIEKRRYKLSDPFKSKFYAFIRIVKQRYPNVASFETYRSRERQQLLYDKFLQGGPLAGKPGTSYHEKGLAVDLIFLNNKRQPTRQGDYSYLHYIGEMCGMTGVYSKGKLLEECHLQDDGRSIKKVMEENSKRFNSILDSEEQELLHKCNTMLAKYVK